MGKSKKRILNRNTDEVGFVLKRSEAVSKILSEIKNNKLSDDTQKLISLFGISMEELFEAGGNYEEISAIKHLLRFN